MAKAALLNCVKTLEKTLEEIESEEDFFKLYDALVKHKSGFLHNRYQLLEAWKRGGKLYTLRIKETDELYDNFTLRKKLAVFADPKNPKPSWLNLPVFCWRDAGDTCVMLWTAPHIRRIGLAKELLELLGINRVYNVLPESRSFWEHLAIAEVDSLPRSGEPL
jgi:hypothetical protein